jgi:hypothetical protein
MVTVGAKVFDVENGVEKDAASRPHLNLESRSANRKSGDMRNAVNSATNRRMSRRRSSLAMVANLQASDGPGEAVTEEGKKEIEMARARQTPHRMDLRKMSRKMSLTPMAGNVAEAEAAAAAAAAGNITTLYASSDIRTKALHNLTEEDGHCIGKSIVEDFYQSGKRVDVCLKAAREKFKAIDDFVAGWKADGSKGKEVLW